MRNDAMTLRMEEAMRFAAQAHAGQSRKGSDTPYFEHVAAAGLILDRAGFSEDVVIAGLLHDVVEDTPVSFEEVAELFGATVSDLVRHCSEVKTDELGDKRPWIDRKRDHIAALASAPIEARGIILADKLHNLISIELDLRDERPVWRYFMLLGSKSFGIIMLRSTVVDRAIHVWSDWRCRVGTCWRGSRASEASSKAKCAEAKIL